jgi:hypothetical protein
MAEKTFLCITVAYNGVQTRLGFSESADSAGKRTRPSYREVDSQDNDEETIELVAMWLERRLAKARGQDQYRLF